MPKVTPVRRNMLERTDDGDGLASGNERSAELTSKPRPVAWSTIRTDGGTQMRVGMSQATIDEYTEAMRNGSKFPPLVVFVDENGNYWLADGFHRYNAQRQAFGTTHVADCIVMPGGTRHAILYAAQANAKHGLARTPDDKRQAVDTLLADADWAKWSDNEIAERCAVSQPFVSKRRKQFTYNVISEPDTKANTERTYTTKHGTTATMKTGKIGKRSKVTPPTSYPVRSIEAKPATHEAQLPTTITLTFALLGDEAERKAQSDWFKGLEQTTLGAYMQALYQTNGEL